MRKKRSREKEKDEREKNRKPKKHQAQWDHEEPAEPAAAPRFIAPTSNSGHWEGHQNTVQINKTSQVREDHPALSSVLCSRATADIVLGTLAPQLPKQYFIRKKILVSGECEWSTLGTFLAGAETIFKKTKHKNMMGKQAWP